VLVLCQGARETLTEDGRAWARCASCLKDHGGPLDDSRTTAGNVIANYGSMN
jgi:hypothetical protein